MSYPIPRKIDSFKGNKIFLDGIFNWCIYWIWNPVVGSDIASCSMSGWFPARSLIQYLYRTWIQLVTSCVNPGNSGNIVHVWNFIISNVIMIHKNHSFCVRDHRALNFLFSLCFSTWGQCIHCLRVPPLDSVKYSELRKRELKKR